MTFRIFCIGFFLKYLLLRFHYWTNFTTSFKRVDPILMYLTSSSTWTFFEGDCLSWLCKKVEKRRGLGHRIICAFFTSHKIEAITRGTTMCCRQTLQRVTTCWLFLPSKIMTTAYYTNGGLYNRGRGRSQGLLRAWHTLDKCFLLGIRFWVNCVFRTLVPNLWRQMCLSTFPWTY